MNPNEELRGKLLAKVTPTLSTVPTTPLDPRLRESLTIQPPQPEELAAPARPRSTRVRKQPMIVHVPPDVLDWAKLEAMKAGRSLSSFVAQQLGRLAAEGKA